MEEGYNLEVSVPSSEDYRRLRISAGLSAKSAEGAAVGLPNTLFGVIVRKDGKVVGMGRVVGDGGLFFQVVDIAVEPEHQGRGLGKAIVGKISEYLREATPSGAYVSLIADGEAHRLYAQFGFEPTAPASIGMALPIRYF
jgi:GNAT superfamily N-acetyltransferase